MRASPARLRPHLLATGLLLVVSALYVVSRSLQSRWPWLEWIHAFSEAAMVGALADWFAVVALFRHPLGLPIPHTAIIPQRKKDIAQTIESFILENFLNNETVSPWLDRFHFASEAALFIENHKEQLADKIKDLLPKLLSALDDAKIEELLLSQTRSLVDGIKIAPVLGEFFENLRQNGFQDEAITRVLKMAREFVIENKARIQNTIASEMPLPEKLPPFFPMHAIRQMIAQPVAEKTVSMICTNLSDAANDPGHELRQAIAEWADQQMTLLKNSEGYLKTGERIKNQVLNDPGTQALVRNACGRVKAALLEDIASGNSRIRGKLVELIESISQFFQADLSLQQEFDSLLKKTALDLLSRNRASIGRFIYETVEAWDSESMVVKVEEAVGDDLQFIRLNGTLVGGIVGLLIHTLDKVIWK